MMKIDHMNIVQIYEYYLYTHEIFIVMEFLEGGELFYQITEKKASLTENRIRSIMKQLLSAVSYLHSNNIGRSTHIKFYNA